MRKVNVRDMIFYVISKGFIILPISIICAAVFGVHYYYSFDKEYVLTDEMKEKLDEVWELQEEYQKYVEANEISGILDMDTSDYYFVRIGYLMKGFPIDSSVYDKIVDDIESESFREELINKSGVDIDVLSLGHLTQIWTKDTEDGKAVFYDFKTDNEQDAQAIFLAAREMIEKSGGKYTGWEDDSEWLEISYSTWVDNFDYSSDYLRKSIYSFENNLDEAKQLFDEEFDELDDKEKKCYKIYYLNEELVISKKMILKKALFGLLFGAFASCFVCFAAYTFNSKIYTIDEIKDIYKVPCIGLLDINELSNKKSSFARKKRYRFDDLEFVRAFVESLPGNVVVLYDSSNSNVVEFEQKLFSDKRNTYPFLHKNADIQLLCKDFDSVVIVVALACTEYREFERELEVCDMQGVSVEGIIAIV